MDQCLPHFIALFDRSILDICADPVCVMNSLELQPLNIHVALLAVVDFTSLIHTHLFEHHEHALVLLHYN